jgi:hypothetical protein
MAKALKKVKEQHSDATFDDAKDYFVMLSLDKKSVQFHGKGKISGPQKKKRDKYMKLLLNVINRLTYANVCYVVVEKYRKTVKIRRPMF